MSQDTTYQTALEYTRRGWVVIPLYGLMPDGSGCSCENPHCPPKNWGKHPIGKEWQRRGPLSPADCYSLFAEPDLKTGAYRNAGLLTGRASGIWALDEDPANGGRETLEKIESTYGPLPATLTNFTGSSGRHFLWRMPDFPIDNSRGRLPEFGPGLDVRGDGGQIVIPGSVSGKGSYGKLVDVEVLDPPEWLLDLLRAPVVSGAVGGLSVDAAELPLCDDMPEAERARLASYADNVCSAELSAYLSAQPGSGSIALYRASISMIEIAQSPWNPVTLGRVHAALESARATRVVGHPTGGGQSVAEFGRIWNSAMSKAAGKGRPVPAHPDAGVRLDIPFSFGPEAPGKKGSGVGMVYDESATAPGDPVDGTYLDLAPLREAGILRPDAGAWGKQIPAVPPAPECPDLEKVQVELDGLRETEERKAYLRALVPRLVGCGTAEVMVWRDVCCAGSGGLRRGEFDTLLREAKKAHAEATEAAETAARRAQNALRIQAAQERGSLLPGPHAPLAVARELIKRWPATDGQPHTLWWQGDFYEWEGPRWVPLPDSMMQQRLYLATEHAQFENKEGELAPWCPRRASISDVESALAMAVLQRPAGQLDDRVIAFRNGVYDVAADTLTPHTPVIFNLNCLPYDYDPSARCPNWLAFLTDVLPGDQGAIDFLQEWFGYVISGRTDLQKIADLVGPPRSGKGTIARTLRLLVGPEQVCEPSLSGLASHFGKQGLINKTLAIMPDVNWNVQDVAEASEVIKNISGEDSPDIPRKGRPDWHGQLAVRFMIMGNDLPKFNDPSGALVNRMIHVRFRKTFLGSEDASLGGRLREELPGILNWALGGLRRLQARGKFVEHDSSRDTAGEISRGISAIAAFMEDYIAIANPDAEPIRLDRIYAAFRRWCEREEGRDRVPMKNVFSRDLQSAGRGAITIKRKYAGPGKTGPKEGWVFGVAPAFLGAFDPPAGQASEWLIGGGS